jgi:NADH:ubiquinone oxidoreductase subunit 2 (subunit N)
MAYSSISIAANIFFSLITGIENQYDDVIFLLIIYVFSALILFGLFSIYYNSNYLKQISLNYSFPKSNMISFFLNSNKYYIFIFLMGILLINGFPPFVSFGIKFFISIDFISNISNFFVYIFMLFNLVGFLFYINIIILYFNSSKQIKNHFYFKKGSNFFILNFFIITLAFNIIIWNFDLFLM